MVLRAQNPRQLAKTAPNTRRYALQRRARPTTTRTKPQEKPTNKQPTNQQIESVPHPTPLLPVGDKHNATRQACILYVSDTIHIHQSNSTASHLLQQSLKPPISTKTQHQNRKGQSGGQAARRRTDRQINGWMDASTQQRTAQQNNNNDDDDDNDKRQQTTNEATNERTNEEASNPSIIHPSIHPSIHHSHPPTHSLTHSLTHSATSRCHSLTHSLTHLRKQL